MLIEKAYAQAADAANETMTTLAVAGADAQEPSLLFQFLPIIILGVLFYVLLIMPQQKRFKEHAKMLNELQKGDKVTTSGGLIGKVHKLVDDNEVVVDLGDVKVTVLRSAIQGKTDLKPANDAGKKPDTPKAKKPKKKA